MSNFLLIDAAALIKIWAMGFFVLHLDGIIHILPFIAVFAFTLRFLYNKTKSF
jgi:hypothetical protein